MVDDKEREPLVVDDQGSELVSSTQESPRSNRSGRRDGGDRTIEWTGVNYAVTDALGCTKTILRDCYGSVRGGEVCAVLGPSGAGKSSLLNVLSGRVTMSSSSGSGSGSGADGHDHGHGHGQKRVQTRGTVLVGGKRVHPSEFRRHIAYVMQDDVLGATTTPREALRFSAKLRLDPGTPDDAIETDIDRILHQLGLTECADVFIGDARKGISGISGGQRKRTSVGVEIITQPSILFLDEPTSGLDFFSAESLVKVLRTLGAANNCPILCTIHQPASEVFFLFHSVIFLKSGRVFWQGPVQTLSTSMEQLGHKVAEGYNVADRVMYVCQTVDDGVTHAQGFFQPPAPELAERHREVCATRTGTSTGTGTDDDIDGERRHSWPTPYNSSSSSSSSSGSGSGDRSVGAGGMEVKAAFVVQMQQLVRRDLSDALRDRGALLTRFGSTAVVNGIIAVVFWQAGKQDDGVMEEFEAHYGAIYMVSIASMFMAALPVSLTFPIERPMFLREFKTGHYTAEAYFISKAVVEVPVAYVQVLVQYVIVYWLIGFRGDFMSLVLAALLNGAAASSLALVVGCAFDDVKQVIEVNPMVFLPQLIFSGLSIRTEMIPVWLRWLQHICALKLSLAIVLLMEFNSDNENCQESEQAQLNCASLLVGNNIHEHSQALYWLVLLLLIGATRFGAAYILVLLSTDH